MFVFKTKQQVYNFGDVTIGGQPGENPTVLIGGMFFKGQPIVNSSKEGTFDKELAKQWLDSAILMSHETGHPLMIQVYAATAKAMEEHLGWLSENFDGSFVFESSRTEARIRGIEFCRDSGLQDRAIYNSINQAMKTDEKELLSASKIDKAVVLGWSPKSTNLDERMTTIKEMISSAGEIGITKMLVDPATMPVGAGYGLEYRTILAIKSELGLPTCLAPHNAPSAWRFLKKNHIENESTHMSAVVASTVTAQIYATDCIMFGSIERSKEVFTAVSLIGNAIASAIAEANHALGLDSPLFDPPTSG